MYRNVDKEITVEDVVSHLRRVELFAGLDEDSLKAIALSCRRRKFPPKTTLFLQDDPGQTMYMIVSGTVSIQTATSEGEIVHIAQRTAGQIVGEFSMLDRKPRSADAVTGTQIAEMIMLDREPFLRVMAESPMIAENIILFLLDRLRGFTLNKTAMDKLDVMGRLASFLLESARSRGEEKPDGTIMIPLGMTQQEIANRIGASRETVTRSLGRLEKMNVIQRDNGMTLLRDPRRLQRLCTI